VLYPVGIHDDDSLRRLVDVLPRPRTNAKSRAFEVIGRPHAEVRQLRRGDTL
jgi:hypothetical protein